ncbi:MAG: EamA family transporter [Bacteroidetes bacterium]|nr:EamA family transporter [Bacteroidota bacterium]
MFFLIIGILCNILLLLILRAFQTYHVAAFPAIVVNYFVAGSFSLLFTEPKSVYVEAGHLWFPAVGLGALFISVFYTISVSTSQAGIAITSVANKMSVVIPVVLAFVLYQDVLQGLKIFGIAIALLSIFLISPARQEKKKTAFGLSFLLPLFVFLGSGIIDAAVNFAQKKLVQSSTETACFLGLTFCSAGLIGLFIFLFFYKKESISYPKMLLAGLVLGTPNYFSVYFIMKVIENGSIQSSVLYPIINISVMLGSTLCAYLFFSEKLNTKNFVGLALSVLAIVCIALSN